MANDAVRVERPERAWVVALGHVRLSAPTEIGDLAPGTIPTRIRTASMSPTLR